jgi:hypothetical protein
MNCETATDLVVDSLMDDLDPQDAERLEAHLASCGRCAATAADMRQSWDGLGQLAVPTAPNPESMIRFGRQLERSRRRPAWSTGLKAAAVVGLLLAGAVLGRLPGGEAPGVTEIRADSDYILLVRGDEPDRRLPEAQLVAEYRAWANDLASRGTLVGGEKLADDSGRWVSTTERSAEELSRSNVSGFFLIRASSYDEAVDLARQSPHVAYGGILEVRAIDRQ